MSTPCWQRIELTSKFFGQTKMADFERKSAIARLGSIPVGGRIVR